VSEGDGSWSSRATEGGFETEEIADDLGQFLGGDMAVGVLVELDHGARVQQPRQATLSMVNWRWGSVSSPGGCGVDGAGILDAVGAGDVAGGAMADMDDVFADGAMPELIVEGGDAPERGGSDIGDRADPFEGGFGQVPVMFLDGLQQGNDGIGRAADARDGFVDELERVRGHRSEMRGCRSDCRWRGDDPCRGDRAGHRRGRAGMDRLAQFGPRQDLELGIGGDDEGGARNADEEQAVAEEDGRGVELHLEIFLGEATPVLASRQVKVPQVVTAKMWVPSVTGLVMSGAPSSFCQAMWVLVTSSEPSTRRAMIETLGCTT
jgi:hypothetical protein